MKAKLLISAVVLGMALPSVMPVIANAADTDAAATSASKSASVTVVPGELTLTKTGTDNADQMAPSFQFANAKVSTGEQKGLKATGFANKINTDSYTGSVLSVDDNSGTGNGWNVTAKLGAFSSGDHTLDGATLNMVPDGTTNQTKADTTALKAGGDAVVVFNAAKGSGLGTSTTDFKGSTLDLPTADYAGTYTAPLTYTLTSGPADNPTA